MVWLDKITGRSVPLLLVFLNLFLASCGGNSGSGTQGGSTQGTPLSLAKVTTTSAGKSFIGSQDGSNEEARFNNPNGVTTDGTNLYVADTSNHTIRKVVIATGAVTTLAGTAGESGSADGTGAAARFNKPFGVTTDGTNLFVADTFNHTIRKVVIATGVVTTLAGTAGEYGSNDGAGAAARFYFPCGITADNANLYIADTENCTIRKVVMATGEATTLAGTAGEYGSTDGIGAAARFYQPFGVTTDGTNLFVADTYNNTIRKVVIATSVVDTLAGTAGSSGATDDTGTAARFYQPAGITMDGTNLYVADTFNHTIRKVLISTGAVSTLAGMAGSPGSIDDTGAAARFNYPYDITTDGTSLYVADTLNNTIRKVAISTGTATTLAGSIDSSGATDGAGAASRFKNPRGVTTDGTNLYVADHENHTIRKVVISTGAVTTLAGTADESGSADGTGAAARFNRPEGITTDGTNLFVADTDNHTIRKVVIATGAVTTLAGTAGASGFADGDGLVASFSNPRGITTDNTNLYVADTGNHTIRKVVIATGAVTTLAGTAGASGFTDGAGLVARFSNPRGIATDGTYLYVADYNNHTFRRVEISTGVVTTLAGKAGESGSTDDGGEAARFYYPEGITTDGTNLYVADTNNHTIRKVVIATGVVTTLVGTAGPTGSTDGTGAAARFYYPNGITTDGTDLYVTDTRNNTIRRIQ
jgi:sugar lactone lactonase YvrE